MDLNEGTERMFGVRRHDVLNQPVAQLVATGGSPSPGATDLATVLSEDPAGLLDRDLEVMATGPDGRSFVAELAIARASSVFVVWIRDVSARRDAASIERRELARELAGHIAVEEVIAKWDSMNHGVEELLATLSESMDFSFGVLWVKRGCSLHARSTWSGRPGEQPGFEGAERPLSSGGPQAPSVEAWLSRTPVIVVDLPAAPPFVGRDMAVAAGLRGAVALPAVSGDFPHAVFELYSRESLHPRETLPRSLTGMGRELGTFFARRSGELGPHELTPRERQILQLTAGGMSGKLVAQHLNLSPSTVKTHFENIYAKWGVNDRSSAVAKALRAGLIE
jgi:DNA-binding NarL/FixJ family response regulator